jgi:hypothetical protein
MNGQVAAIIDEWKHLYERVHLKPAPLICWEYGWIRIFPVGEIPLRWRLDQLKTMNNDLRRRLQERADKDNNQT